MAKGPTYRVPRRRRREGRTDYKKRLSLLKSGKTRAVVRKQANNTIVQFVDYDPDGDIVRTQATAHELDSLGWESHTGNLPAAYLTGYLAGTRASEDGIEEAVLDIGRHVPEGGSAVFSALQGVLDAGIEVPHGEEILPEEDRHLGAHIDEETTAMTEEVRETIEEGSP